MPRRLQEQLEGVGHDSCQVLALLFYHILSGVVDCRIGNDHSMKPPMVQLGCDGTDVTSMELLELSSHFCS